jgi:predicted adenine nucleotide alpha hydrolase (AANH) superfamily ATPase
MRVALHTCCGPCLLEPFDALVAEGIEQVTAIYFNPNIHPVAEYTARRDAFVEYTSAADIDIVELEYDPAAWLETVGSHARSVAQRCRACYGLRLERVAQWAAENGFDAVATTLTVSPFQDVSAIEAAGQAACERAGVEYLSRDYRDRYTKATTRSREAGMYRQNYCGCVMSDIEAREQRAARRAAKRAASGSG